jgi:hypothetical protein
MYSPRMFAETEDISHAPDFQTALAALPEHDRKILDAFLTLRASISAMSRQYNWNIADSVAWMQRPDIRPILRAIAQSAEEALRIRAALARQTAIDTLEQAALDARTPQDQRRAGTVLARACQLDRWGERPRPPSRPREHIPAHMIAHTPAQQTSPQRHPAHPHDEPPCDTGPAPENGDAAPADNHTASDQSKTEQSKVENLTPRQIVAILTEALVSDDSEAQAILDTFAASDCRIEVGFEQAGDSDEDHSAPAPRLPSLKGARFENPVIVEEFEEAVTISIAALVPARDPETQHASPSHLIFHFHRSADPPGPWHLTRLALHTSGP